MSILVTHNESAKMKTTRANYVDVTSISTVPPPLSVYTSVGVYMHVHLCVQEYVSASTSMFKNGRHCRIANLLAE